MSENGVRLMIVDDHQVVRLGLRTLFSTVPGWSIVGEAGGFSEAVSEAQRCRPDVVIMDVRLPDGSGVDACREMRSVRPETRVIMLTSFSDEESVVASIMAGAAGYLLKETDPERLIEAIRSVSKGGSLLDPAVTETVLDWIRQVTSRNDEDPLTALTEQERKVLPLIAQGKTNREIAGQLFLSEHTIKTYVSSILRKLRLVRRAEAAAYIARLHLPDRGS